MNLFVKQSVVLAIGALGMAGSLSVAADDLKDNLVTYLNAWTEQDVDKRNQMIESVISEDFLYRDPSTTYAGVDVVGQQALSDWITGYQYDMYNWGLWPVVGQVVTNIDVVGSEDDEERSFRFDWKITAFGGSYVVAEGLDAGTASSDGKITSIHGFYNKLKPRCAAPIWQAGAYSGGDQVVNNGVTYQANWWTQLEPGSDSEQAQQEWKSLGECAETL